MVATAASGPDQRADRETSGPGGPDQTEASDDDDARLSFGGIVLEERAVGVTVDLPRTGPRRRRRRTRAADLELPGRRGPRGTGRAGLRPGRTEYADLRAPDLEVRRVGDGLRITGEFPTVTHPTGSGPEATGRAYPIVVTVAPSDPARPGRWVPASADLELGDRRVAAVEGELRLAD